MYTYLIYIVLRGQGGGLGLWATTIGIKSTRGEMNAGDATCRMSATELVCAAPSQQRLRRSSVAAALQPSTQLVVFVASLLVSSRCCQQHLEEGCGGTSRGDASCAQHQLRHSSISSVAAAEVGAGSVPRP